ncbi:MAG: 4-alpha-glucanotransferase [Terriglobales bacterium]
MVERASGILLHPTSLPSRGGIGDLGPAAHEFIEFLADAGQKLWQVLPLAPAAIGNSPYSSISAFAGNPLLISLERLVERGWIDAGRLAILPERDGNVNFERVKAIKLPLIFEAAGNFLDSASGADRARFEQFCRDNAWWLDDFTLFGALRHRFHHQSWNRWPSELARRDPEALARVREEAARTIDVARVIQFAFYEQWRAVRRRCEHHGIRIIGDVAIFVNYDSADVWTHPDIFQLKDDLEPEVVAGVPPDAFSQTGQRWGNPLYRWEVLKQRGYDWWVQRMRWAVTTCDIVRLDHFRGFEKYWEIPASEPTAVNGRWVEGPGIDLFDTLRRELGGLPFIAEDLGFITQEVHELREQLGIPGMRVLQFGFGNPGAHIYLPHRYEPNTVVYTGTHDNDTTCGWWHSQATAEERRYANVYLGADESNVNWAFMRAALGSVARYAIVPLQDVLGLGSEARMNIPSRTDGNWGWRYTSGALSRDAAERLRVLTEVSDRYKPSSAGGQHGYWEAREDFSA